MFNSFPRKSAKQPRQAIPALVLALLIAVPVRAEIVVGEYAPTAGEPGVVGVFADDAQGNTAPYRVFGGPASQMWSAGDMAYVASEGVIYVSDFRGQVIRVFPAGATGDAPPLREIDSPSLGQPRSIVVVPAAGELIAVAGACCLGTYDRLANGEVAAQRFVSGASTQLNNPAGIAYRAATDEIFVGDNTTPTVTGEILVFPRTANGNVAPARVISGPTTQLGIQVWAVAAHPVLPEIYALVSQGGGAFGIVSFDASASGDATPLRVVGGSNTLMVNSQGFDYNPRSDEFVVLANSYGGGTPAVLVFPRAAQGNVAPSRIISGANTGFPGAQGFGIMAADLDPIFADGFNVGPFCPPAAAPPPGNRRRFARSRPSARGRGGRTSG